MRAGAISGAMAVEAALAKEESERLESTFDSLPDNHPIKVAAAREKMMIGDLAGLPAGHPLLIAMDEARLRYETNLNCKNDEEEAKAQEEVKIRKAKKLDAQKAAKNQRKSEDEREERLRSATKRINSSMNETMESLRMLNENIMASMEDFAGDRYAQMKLERLSRVVGASLRGVSESKLNAGRMVSNG